MYASCTSASWNDASSVVAHARRRWLASHSCASSNLVWTDRGCEHRDAGSSSSSPTSMRHTRRGRCQASRRESVRAQQTGTMTACQERVPPSGAQRRCGRPCGGLTRGRCSRTVAGGAAFSRPPCPSEHTKTMPARCALTRAVTSLADRPCGGGTYLLERPSEHRTQNRTLRAQQDLTQRAM